jgi:hypothetical protein
MANSYHHHFIIDSQGRKNVTQSIPNQVGPYLASIMMALRKRKRKGLAPY